MRVSAGHASGEPLTQLPDGLLWSRGGTVSAPARAVLQTLRTASDYGLRPGDYGHALAAQLAALDARPASGPQWQQFDTALSNAVHVSS